MQTRITATLWLLACLLPAGSVAAPDLDPMRPELREDVREKTRPRLPAQSLSFPFVTAAELSVYVVPFERWCTNHPDDSLEGRLTVQFHYPRRADGSLVPARLVIETGLAEAYSQPIRLGSGRFSVTSDVFNLSARKICSDRCTEFSVRADSPADAARINSGPHRACVL